MKEFGIIGWPLEHSFSANHFNRKFEEEAIDAEYKLYPLERIEAFPALIERVPFTGMNVTMPYKQAVIPYLSRLDETAAAIGAVNVIQFLPNGERIGYNTDALGFIDSIRPHLLPSDKQALVLGTGGAAKAAKYGLEKLGLTVHYVSRTPQEGMYGYENAPWETTDVIVNATPLGMHPNVEACAPLPYHLLRAEQLLFDCIYNPEQTRFLQRGREAGCRTVNGHGMLMGQAKAAWEIWERGC